MMKVTVSDPRTIGEGRNMYTSYRVESNAKFVRRRYSDFRWLYHRLQTERPGAIIPIIPHRRALTNETKFSDELIHERLIQLGQFIVEVCNHVELDGAPSLGTFLTAELGEEFEVAKKELERTKATSSDERDDDTNSNGLYSDPGDDEMVGLTTSAPVNVIGKGRARKAIRNVVARAGTLMSIRSGKGELETTEEEPQIAAILEYIDAIEGHAKGLNHDAAILVKSSKETSVSVHDVGQSLFGWACAHQTKHCPEGSDTMVNMLGKVSKFAGELSTVLNKKADEEATKFEASLVDLGNRILAAKIALKKRKQYQVTYTTRIKQISQRQTALGKLQSSGKTVKVPQAQTDLATAEREAEASRKDLVQVSQRVVREAERIQPDLEKQLTKILANYAKIQTEYNQKMYMAWSKLTPHLEIEDMDDDNKKEEPTSEVMAPSAPTEDLLLMTEEEEDNKDARPAAPTDAPPVPPMDAPPQSPDQMEEAEEVFI